ncbi:MAG: ROK family protein [Candidatus Sumerlaeia bacterium]|nr:ROK family protein [Candidatus Sumerlaeia bacterium]
MAGKSKDYVVGVDLGGTKILAGVVAETGEILGRVKAKTAAEAGYRNVLSTLATSVDLAISESKIPRPRIRAVGVGVPGPVDPETGVVKIAPNLGWKNVPVKKLLEKQLGLPVLVENDVNAGTVGEHRFGAGVGVKDLVGIFVGTGIGGGLIFNGTLYHGFSKAAGEIGHMIIDVNGPRCGCGNKGCFEAMASRTAILRELAAAIRKGSKTVLTKTVADKNMRQVGSSVIADAFFRGDKLTVKVVKRAARYCGVGVASILNLLNPEMVVLGGGVVEAFGSEYVHLVAKAARKRTFEVTFQGVRIVPALLRDDAVLLGAASLAREKAERAE